MTEENGVEEIKDEGEGDSQQCCGQESGGGGDCCCSGDGGGGSGWKKWVFVGVLILACAVAVSSLTGGDQSLCGTLPCSEPPVLTCPAGDDAAGTLACTVAVADCNKPPAVQKNCPKTAPASCPSTVSK